MKNTLTHSHAGGHTGITLRAFRLNSVANHIMFTGRRGRVYDEIVLLSGVRPGDSVLDVGSSSGYLTHRLAAAALPSGRVVGVDPSQPAIAHARRRARPGLEFKVGVVQDLDLPSSSFDLVTCTLAMHHIPADQRQIAFTEMFRVTRPGGRLFVADLMSVLRLRGQRAQQPAAKKAAKADPLEDLAATAGYQIQSAGKLPLLGYIVAVRPQRARG
ncbi:MAG TPA: class I SAM-dependent methyltransferase [Actinocrinis sp.]|jgi:ubiquinone/menaquinone biosynthesis C-methylase UbiE